MLFSKVQHRTSFHRALVHLLLKQEVDQNLISAWQKVCGLVILKFDNYLQNQNFRPIFYLIPHPFRPPHTI